LQGASRIPGIKKKKQIICPRCKKTVPAKTVFCEFCGARVAHPPACTLCGTLLAPDSRFCPSCGRPVPTNPERPDVKGKPADQHNGSTAQQRENSAESLPLSAESASTICEKKNPDIPDEGGQSPATGKPIGKQKAWQVKRSAVTTVPDTGAQTKPLISRLPIAWIGSHKYLVLIIIAVLVIAGMAAFGIPGLPALNFSSGTSADNSAERLQSTTESSMVSDPEQNLTNIIVVPPATLLTPGPTQVPPENLRVYFQAERNPTNRIVTVSFMGGKGQVGVRDVFVRLTRSDGQVLTGTFKPLQAGGGIELQGTEKVDRIEVIVNYHTGAAYTVIDRTFEWKKQL
jgi:RNA polymerase subunit RPABC4/transcription elongation factor Spt4